MSQHQAWIELDAGVRDEDAVADLVAELGADWEVRPFRGVGVDPTAALIALSVPLAVFFRTFLELAAADTYAAVKSWLIRLGASNRATVEVRDRDWGQVFRFPVDPDDEALEVLRGPL